jgi:hypothetical protein
MRRWLRYLIHSHAIGEALFNARACSQCAKGCKARSLYESDAWSEAAFKHRQRRRYWMDMARSLAGR